MPDRPVPPAGYLLRYDNATGAPLFVNTVTGEKIPAASFEAKQATPVAPNAAVAPVFANEAAGERNSATAFKAEQTAPTNGSPDPIETIPAAITAPLPSCPETQRDSTKTPCASSCDAPALPPERCVGFVRRFFAFMIDLLILSLPHFLFSVAGIASTISGGALSESIFFRFSALDILWYIAVTTYFVVLTKCCGATLGKQVLRICVVRSDGRALDWWSVLYRETVGRYLTSLLCIGYLVLIGDRQHRGFHDMLADTRVVYSLR